VIRLSQPLSGTRRRLLRGLACLPLLSMSWLLLPGRAWAALAGRPRAAFRAQTLPEALEALEITRAASTGVVRLAAPARAENGAVVPLKVESSEAFTAVNILCAGNPVPMVARFEFAPRVGRLLSTRIKMGASADITVVTESPDGMHRADLAVEVTIGGCN
jgi:sulfur-oxidizing protein SoxY